MLATARPEKAVSALFFEMYLHRPDRTSASCLLLGQGRRQEGSGCNSYLPSTSCLCGQTTPWRMNFPGLPGGIVLLLWAAAGDPSSDPSCESTNSERIQAYMVLSGWSWALELPQLGFPVSSVVEAMSEPSPGVRGLGVLRKLAVEREAEALPQYVEGPGE